MRLSSTLVVISNLMVRDSTHLQGTQQPDTFAPSAAVLMTIASSPEHRHTPQLSGVCFCLPALYVITAPSALLLRS